MVFVEAERKTFLAEIGSQWILNSAQGVTLPMPLTEPPMMMRRSRSAMMPGSRAKAREMFVRGPRQRIETSPGALRISSQMIFSLGCWRTETGDGEVGVAEAIGAVKLTGVVGRACVAGRSGADARVLGRIELLDAGLDVARREFGGDVALDGGDGDDFEPWVKEGEGEGEGVVDSGIAVDDDFSGHGFRCVLNEEARSDGGEFTVFGVVLGVTKRDRK